MKALPLALVLCSTAALGAVESPSFLGEESLATLQALVEQGLGNVLVGPSGELILWEAQTGRGFISGGESGLEDAGEFRGPQGLRLAVSPGGARAFLTNGGRTVEIHGPGDSRRQLQVGDPMGGVAWLGERHLALSPLNGDHVVEVWDVESGELLQGIQEVPRIAEAPGFPLLRNTALAWDPERRRLHTLDAFTGSYRVYDLSSLVDGSSGTTPVKPVVETQIDDKNRDLWDKRVAALDRQLAERGEFQGASIWRFSPALDGSGNAWMVERCDKERETVHFLVVDPDGTEHRFVVGTPCCSYAAVPWGESLAFARPGRPDLPGCFDVVARPPLGPPPAVASWLEATPLSPRSETASRRGTDPPSVLERLAPGTDPNAVLDRLASLGAGLTLVCTGGERRAVDCAQRWLDPETPPDDLPLEARSGRAVTGRVTLEGVGVGGVAVALVPADFKTTRLLTLPLALPAGAQEPIREVQTDRDGRFTLPTLAPGDYRLLLELPGGRTDHGVTFTVTAPRRKGRAGGAADSDALELGELDFPAGVSVEIVVTGPDGEPIPDALAGAAQAAAGREQDPGAVTLFQASAGEDGRAVIGGLAPDLPLRVTCQASGHDGWRESFDLPPSFVACSLAPLAELGGQVVGEDGEPLSVASVTITGGSPVYGPLTETARLEEGDEGRFQFEDLEAARFRLVATSPGRGTKALSLTLEPGEARDVGDLVLEPGARWSLRVVEGGEEGTAGEREPIVGATITAVSPPDSLVATTTDTWGEAEVEGPATGPLKIEVGAEGFAPRRVDVPEPARTLDAEPYEVVLERGGWIEAHVWEEGSGEPCAGCRISLHGAGPSQGLVTDSSGTVRSEPLAPGVWQASLVRIQGFGGMVTRSGGHDVRRATVTPGTTTEVRFGDPAETLDVVLSSPPPDSAAWRLVVIDGEGASKLYSLDGSGSAVVRRPAGGALLLLTDGHVTVELGALLEDATDPALIELPSGTLAGRLPSHLEEESPAVGLPRLELVNLSTGRKVAEVEASVGALFRIPFLPTGVYELRGGGRSLGTASVTDGQETYLDGLE